MPQLPPALGLFLAVLLVSVIGAAVQHALAGDPDLIAWSVLSFLVLPLASGWWLFRLVKRHARPSRIARALLIIFFIVLAGPGLARHLLFGLGWNEWIVVGHVAALSFSLQQLWEILEGESRAVRLASALLEAVLGGAGLVYLLVADLDWHGWWIAGCVLSTLLLLMGCITSGSMLKPGAARRGPDCTAAARETEHPSTLDFIPPALASICWLTRSRPPSQRWFKEGWCPSRHRIGRSSH